MFKQLVMYLVLALSNLILEKLFKIRYYFRCQGHDFSNSSPLSPMIT